MAPSGKRRGRTSKTKPHSSSASTMKTVKTDKVGDSTDLSSFSVPKMSQNSRDDPRPVNDLMDEWNDFMACHLEEILLENLFDIFVKAIRQITACGYSEEDAESAVLKSGLYYGIMSPSLNIVNGALIFLKMSEDFGASKNYIFENLNGLVEYLMLEMVYVLKEAKPSLTVGEAMWGLMVCNMDLAEAYAVDGGTLRSYCTIGHEMCEALFCHPKYGYLFQDSHPSTSTSSARWWPERDSPHSMHANPHASDTGNETSNSDPSSGEHLLDIGQMFSINGCVVTVKEEPRKSPSPLKRHCKGYTARTIFKAKVTDWGSLVLDKRLKYLNSLNSNTKMSCSKTSVAGDNLSAATVLETSNTAGLPVENFVSALPAANSPVSPEPSDIPIDFSPDKSSGKSDPRDEKDKMILSLASQVQMLKKEHQHLTDWANKNIMQAAQLLRKYQPELKALRQEKETVEKSEKDKQHNREENSIRRVSEMEYAVANSASHMKMANSTTSKLEEANFVLKQEMEAAKLQALESAANLQNALMREQEALKRAQSWKGKEALLLEELSADKRKVAALQIALEKAKGLCRQIEVRCKQEEIEKEELLAQARYIASKREHSKSLAEMEEEAIRESAETELQKGKVQIKLLESKLFELKSKYESSKLSQARRNLKGSRGGAKVGGGARSVRMERECVMCLTEEKSVVFLPCAHQSLCECCNKLHEEQGMNDCPSCRTPIKRRIRVRFANP